MNKQATIQTLTLMNVSATTAAFNGTVTDMTASSASVGKSPVKIIVGASGVTGTTPAFPIVVSECSTTNGTFTPVKAAGSTSALSITSPTQAGVTDYHAMVSLEYVQATLATPTGTGTPTANLFVLLENDLRYA